MARYEWDEFGNRFWVEDDGTETYSEDLGAFETMAVQAGDKFHRLKRGVQSALGQDVSREAQEAEQLMGEIDRHSPYLSMVGDALPTLATAPISVGGQLANLGLQAGLGAVEGALDYDSRASGGQRAAAGALGGVIGEGAGRVLGRVMHTAKGVADDVFKSRGPAANPAAQAFEELGGSTMAYQRLEQGTNAANLAERAAQGAQASINPPPSLQRVMDENDTLFREVASEAVGLPGGYKNLGPQWKSDALDNFNAQYRAVEQAATGAGELQLSDKLAGRLMKNRQIKAAIDEDDLFEGLSKGTLAPGEYMEARAGLSDHINMLYNQGADNRAIRAEKLLAELDNSLADSLPDGFKDQFARLREQYRVFSLMERKNVINGQGQVNPKTLSDTLNSKASGFGRTATAGGKTTNTETRKLIDLAQSADNPEFKAFRSSGTAENLALGQMVDQAGEAVSGALAGDVRPGLGLLGRIATPGLVGASQKGSGKAFEGAFTPAPQSVINAGAFTGRALLDDQLYPFVGARDDREQ